MFLSLTGLGLAQSLDIGTRWELMIDHYLIDSMAGTHLQLHHPHREGVAALEDAADEAHDAPTATLKPTPTPCPLT